MSSKQFPNEDLSSGFLPLRVKHAGQLVLEAEEEILSRSSGVQFALKTRWGKLNKAYGGGLQFGNIYLIAAPSGSGKSYVRNMIEQDIHDPELNGSYPKKYLTLVFQFEMSGASETIRMLSGKTGVSYGDLMSAEKPFADFSKHKTALQELANRPVFYVETSGNRKQMAATIHKVHEKFPDHQLVIMMDHSLLAETLDEKDEIELLAKLAKDAIKWKKNYDCLIMFLGQTNDKMENPFRLQNPSLHYPTKTDIHGSKQLYWAMDYVAVMNRPELLGIDKYGKHAYDTKDLVAYHQIKARNGELGIVRFKQQFEKGKMIEWV